MLCMIFVFLLIKPQIAVQGARLGLLLWAKQLLPSLLPFLILTQLLIRSGYLDAITKKLCIPHSYFVLFAGTLFGFPMGCKLTRDLYTRGKLSQEEASLLFIIANQMSPAFVGGYIMSETLHAPRLIPLTYLIVYVPSLFYGFWKLQQLSRQKRASKSLRETATKKSTSELKMNFTVLDAGIMNSFEAMLKLGGYIMLFSVIANMCKHVLSAFPTIYTVVAGLLEITGAVNVIDHSIANTRLKYIAILAATAFGGCSGIAQTASLIRSDQTDSSLSIFKYICGRLIISAVTALLAVILCVLL